MLDLGFVSAILAEKSFEEVIEFAANLPPRLKYNQGEKKYILKRRDFVKNTAILASRPGIFTFCKQSGETIKPNKTAKIE